MTTQLFKEWFEKQFVLAVEKFNKKKSLPNSALLILDKVPCHSAAKSLCCGNIKAVFLPPNVKQLYAYGPKSIKKYKMQLQEDLQKLIESDGSSDSVLHPIKNATIQDLIY
ncbi:hypothetical protein AVEN_98744-1 [Araneus ventricosus]|uniref:DDE-1 domain-containing protein n=1 Tax=Araneus ventricosus TaxID=182803 RepID=A0A4Y2P161_ARAVE|nr:hypothetical protein AVEN_98744-1 [Araneus ventricosus]